VHLRICRTCGHVGCCDQSPNHHATKHYDAIKHPIIEGYDPPEGWGWCYIDRVFFDLSDHATPHNGPIPRYIYARANPFTARRKPQVGGHPRLARIKAPSTEPAISTSTQHWVRKAG
jgi:hypothetical protein